MFTRFTMAMAQSVVFWIEATYSFVGGYHCFGKHAASIFRIEMSDLEI
jgi:hypothetical protein